MATEEVGVKLSLKGRPEFTRETEHAEDDLREVGRAADTATRSFGALDSAGGVLRSGLGLVTSVARTALVGLTTLAGASVAGGVALLNMASNAAETEGKFNTVFGGQAGGVQTWISGIQDSVHIATQELQDAVSTFGVFGQAVGVAPGNLDEFSTALAEAGLDLASFSNANPEDVFLALRSGLSGEAEPLRQFGIFLSDASLNAFAAAQGINKTTAEMTEQEKVLLRQQFILANLGAAEGDLERTSQGVANQTRGLWGVMKDLGVEIGNVLTPAAEALLPVLTEGLGEIVDRLRDHLPDLQRAVGGWASSLVELYRVIDDGLYQTEEFGRVVAEVFGTRFGGYISTAIDLVGQLRDNIEGLGTQEGISQTIEELFGPDAAGIFDQVATALGNLFIVVRDTVIPAWQGAVENMGPAAGFGLTLFAEALQYAADNSEELIPVLETLFTLYLTAKVASTIGSVATAVRGLSTAFGLAAVAGGGATGAGGLMAVLGGIGTATSSLVTWFGSLAVAIGPILTGLGALYGVGAAVIELIQTGAGVESWTGEDLAAEIENPDTVLGETAEYISSNQGAAGTGLLGPQSPSPGAHGITERDARRGETVIHVHTHVDGREVAETTARVAEAARQR